MSFTKTTDTLFSGYKPKTQDPFDDSVTPKNSVVTPEPSAPQETQPETKGFDDGGMFTGPEPTVISDPAPVASNNYSDHMNMMSQANAQVDANGNPVYATYSYDPQNDTYTANYSAFGLTGDSATETFTSEQFLADNDRTFASMVGYGTNNEYTDHMNSMAQANAQVDANGNSVYATYSYDPQNDTYTADYSAFGLTGDSATETFTSEQFLADNDRTFSSMEGYVAPVVTTLNTTLALGDVPIFGSTDEAVTDYSSWLGSIQAQSSALTDAAIESGDYSGVEGVNINDINQDPIRVLKNYSNQEVDAKLLEYIEENNIAPYIEYGDQKLFFNTGTETSYPLLAGDAHQNGGAYISAGPIGTYSTVWIEDDGTLEQILNIPALNLAAMFVPFGTAVLTAAKALNGQTLHASDWAKLAVGGLEASGVIVPPSEVGGVQISGTGLMGTTYQQSVNIINAAGSGDFSGVISTLVGGDVLSTIGFDDDTLQGLADASGLDVSAINDGLTTIFSSLIEGDSLVEAITNSGVSLFLDDLGNEGPLSEMLLNGVDGLASILGEWGEALNGSVLAPFLDTVGDVADSLPLEEIINGFQNLSGSLSDVVVDGLDTLTSGAMDLLGSFTDDQSGLTMEDLVVNIGNATGDTLETILGAAGISFAEWIEASPQEQQQMYNQLSNFYSDITDLFDDTTDDVDNLFDDTTDDVEDTTDDDVVEDTTDEFTDEYFENLYNTYGDALDTLTSETGVNIEDLISGAGTSLEDLANATGVSIEELLGGAETSLSDLADATGQTIEELLNNAGTSLEELAEATGTSIDELISGAEGSLDDLITETGTSLEDLVGTASTNLDDLATATGTTLEDLFSATGTAISDLTDTAATNLDALAEATGTSIDDLVSGAGTNLQDLADATGLTIEELLDNAGTSLEDLADATGTSIDDLVSGAGTSLDNLAEATGTTIDDLLTTAADNLSELRDQASSDLVDLATATGTSIDDLIDGAGTSLQNLADATGQTIEDMLESSGTTLEELATATGTSIEDLVSGAGTNLQDLADATGQTIDDLLGQTGTALTDLINETDTALEDLVTEAGTSIDNLVGDAADDLDSLANTAATILEELSTSTGTSIEDLISGTGTTLADMADATGQSIEDLLGGAESGLADLADATGQTIEELLESAGTSLEELAEATGSSIDDLIDGTAGTLEDLIDVTGESIDGLVGTAESNLDELSNATGKTLDELLGGTGDALEDMLNLALGGLGGILGATSATADSMLKAAEAERLTKLASRTTDDLFGDMFEFDTKIEDTQELVDFLYTEKRNRG